MKSICRIWTLFWCSAAALTVMAASVLLMPLVNSSFRMAGICAGALFWCGAAAGTGLLAVAERERRQLLRDRAGVDPDLNRRPGIAEFFSNPIAKAADLMLIGSLAGMLILQCTRFRNSYFGSIVLFLVILSLNMHCLFNGRIYKIAKLKNKERNP